MMSPHDIVIVAAKRTPIGAFQGAFAPLHVAQLGACAIKGALEQANIATDKVDEVYMGCVLTAGVGQSPARQAGLKAGLSNATPCSTINKVCGSAMKAVMVAYDQLKANPGQILVAGGMESMTNAPYLLFKARAGYRIGHEKIIDHMFFDGLEDSFHNNKLMGAFAEDTANKYNFSRDDQDSFAISSVERARNAINGNMFDSEISPIKIQSKTEEVIISQDEGPLKAKPEKIKSLKPAFKDGGTVTAATSSSISDGAAALVITTWENAQKNGLKPLAIIRGHASHAHEPEWFTTAPIGAIKKLCNNINWAVNDVDLFEVNEAFAVVPMAAMKELNIPHDKMNVRGGACALGHPIGASGARVIVTLLNALIQNGLKKGIASVCIGSGEGTAVALEII